MFAIVDVRDALVHARVYKDAWMESRVLDYLDAQSDKHFDLKRVHLFLNNSGAITQAARVDPPIAKNIEGVIVR